MSTLDLKPLKIYNASAGSGKTYTLVQEYLRIILHDKDALKFRSILAMTFTNKAANEMKTRVLEALINLSIPSQKKTQSHLKFLNDTAKNISIDPKLIEQRAVKILNKILHNYSSFSIMTIDKFTHKIIRTFAKDLGVSIDFDVEMDIQSLRRNITDLLFDKIGRNSELTGLMKQYATDNLNEDKTWNFSNQLYEFSDLLFKEDAFKSIALLKDLKQKDFSEIKTEIRTENIKIENHLKGLAQAAVDLIKSKHLEADDFQGKGNSIVKYFTKISAGNFDESAGMLTPASKTILKNVADGKWGHPKSPNKADVDSIGDLLGTHFEQVENAYLTGIPKLKLNKEIYKNLNNLSLLNHLLKIVDEVKEDENILLMTDFYKKISDIIAKEPVPFIYERLGIRYQHFLLDEFQDTSHLQWVNMIPLVHNSLAAAETNLIVGDGKQAIYRWRNGEVEQFTKLPNQIHNPDNIESLNEAEFLFKELGEKISLDNNFRSSKEVVTFNNTLFKDLANSLSSNLKYIYDDVEQNPIKKHKGYINAYLEAKLTEDEQLDYVLKSIQKSLTSGFELKDICLIVRNNKSGSLLANFLTEHNITVISPDSLFIGKDRSVKFLFHLMNSIIQSKDSNYKIKAIEHFASLIDVPATKLIQNNEAFIKENTIIDYFKTRSITITPPDAFHNLYEFVESLVEIFDLSPSDNPFLQFFMEMVHQYETKNNSNIRDFLTWYKDKGVKESIVSPEGANAIQIMTIHKSKGLQFPVVICPFYDWKLDVSRQITWIDNEGEKLPAYFVKMNKAVKNSELGNLYEEEEGKYFLDQLNLLYVAFTRPETALFICGSTSVASPAKNWLEPFFSTSKLFTLKDKHYEYGELELNSNKEEDEINHNYNLVYLDQKMNKPQLSYKSGEEWDVNDIDEKRNFGTLVHLVLSKIKNLAHLDETLNILIHKGSITTEKAKDINLYITELFNNVHFKNYFDNSHHVLNEKEIITPKGMKLIPDKIIITDTETLVVDFKTGQATEKHKKQVANYVKLLKHMNFKNVRGELFYTEDLEVISC
jgi:ATP-dependent exoDNAse (exonuclease V) beta subunit